MATASSNFDGDENPLSESGAFLSGVGGFSDLKKVAGKIRVVTANTDGIARYEGAAFGDDQWSRVVFGAAASSHVNISAATRIKSSSDGDCYVVTTSGTTAVQVYRVDDNSGTLTWNLLASFTLDAAMTSGTALTLLSVGSTHFVCVDDSVFYKLTDATYTTGQPGIQAFADSTTLDLIDSWSAADGATAPIELVQLTGTPGDSASATNTADPTAVTAPGGMSAGQLVLMVSQSRGANTHSISNAGGQSWTKLSPAPGATNVTVSVFWCEFNGTWSANPSVSFGATTCNTVVLMAFSRSLAGSTWAVDVDLVETDFAAAATITINGQTATAASTVGIAGFATPDDNTWEQAGNVMWSQTATKQWRNTSGSDQSLSLAYHVRVAAGPQGAVSKTQVTNGNDAGTTFVVTFYEVPAFTPVDPFGVMGIFGI